MKSELCLLDFIELHIASTEQWEKYIELGTGSLFSPSYQTEHKDPALRKIVPSGPSPKWYERDHLYKAFGEKMVELLRSDEWIAMAKVGGSAAFQPIDVSSISELTIKLHENQFLIDGRNYRKVLFRKAPEISERRRLQYFIETVCGILSPQNITKPDVLKLAEALLDFSFNKNTFGHVWHAADIDDEYRKKGPRANKEPSRNRDDD